MAKRLKKELYDEKKKQGGRIKKTGPGLRKERCRLDKALRNLRG